VSDAASQANPPERAPRHAPMSDAARAHLQSVAAERAKSPEFQRKVEAVLERLAEEAW
jgi:hypothetical protein